MAANTIDIIEKSGGSTANVAMGSGITLAKASVIKLPVGPEQLASTTRVGNDLQVTLKSGEQILISNFFGVPGEDERSELMLED